MDDLFSDPRFPDRPQHPDFWKMVAAMNYLDGEALEGGRSAEDILSQYADPASVAYLARQRMLRALGDGIMDPRAVALSLYVDAFALGCQFTMDKELAP